MQTLSIGEVGTAVATFTDKTQTPPVSVPLASAATWTVDDDSIVSISMTKDGTSDGISTCTVTALKAGAFNLTCVGEGDSEVGEDTITGTESGVVRGEEDNAVDMSWQPPAPPSGGQPASA